MTEMMSFQESGQAQRDVRQEGGQDVSEESDGYRSLNFNWNTDIF